MNQLTPKGYIRYRIGSSGDMYEHRAVARIAWGPRVPWPRGAHVHHMDAHRPHNCRCNLLIIDPRLHDARVNAKAQ